MEARTKAASAEYRGLLWGVGGASALGQPSTPLTPPHGQARQSGGDAKAGMGGGGRSRALIRGAASHHWVTGGGNIGEFRTVATVCQAGVTGVGPAWRRRAESETATPGLRLGWGNRAQ